MRVVSYGKDGSFGWIMEASECRSIEERCKNGDVGLHTACCQITALLREKLVPNGVSQWSAETVEGYCTALHFSLLKSTKDVMRLASGKHWAFWGTWSLYGCLYQCMKCFWPPPWWSFRNWSFYLRCQKPCLINMVIGWRDVGGVDSPVKNKGLEKLEVVGAFVKSMLIELGEEY